MPVLLGLVFSISETIFKVGFFKWSFSWDAQDASLLGLGVFDLVSSAENAADSISLPLAICMLVTSVLMQSAVNVLNDYMDYKRGADTKENQLDSTDAVLVYNNVSLRSVLVYFFVLMALALVLGLYVVFQSNLTTLIIGLIGALMLVLYSVGKTPISYMPLGEAVSGIVMGSLIMLATCNVLLGCVSLKCVVCSIPLILCIGLINFTNNTCDIEKDIEAKRRTLSVILGRKRAKNVYIFVMTFAILCVIVLVGLFFSCGVWVCVFMVLALIPICLSLLKNPLTLSARGAAMGGAVTFNITLNTFYALAILAGCLGVG